MFVSDTEVARKPIKGIASQAREFHARCLSRAWMGTNAYANSATRFARIWLHNNIRIPHTLWNLSPMYSARWALQRTPQRRTTRDNRLAMSNGRNALYWSRVMASVPFTRVPSIQTTVWLAS